jgi:predicted metal-binding protein
VTDPQARKPAVTTKRETGRGASAAAAQWTGQYSRITPPFPKSAHCKGTKLSDQPCLHVCTTCKSGDGQRLFDAMSALLPADAPVRLRPVVCLSGCSHGCTAAIAAPGKWTYMLAGLNPDLAGDLLAYGAAYARSATGMVPRADRADTLRDAIHARIPAL